jgi:hypothetical protein
VIALLAAIVFFAVQTSPESFWEGLAARSLQRDLALEERPEVDLQSEGTLAALSGSFGGGTVVVRDPNLEGLRPERLTIDLEPFEVDVLGSVAGGAIRAQGPVPGSLEARLPEGEVRRLADEGSQGFPVSDLQLEDGRAVVSSEANIFGNVLPLIVAGSAEIRGGSLLFEPEEVTAAGVPLPPELNEAVLENASFEYPLDLPVEGRVTSGEVLRDRLVIRGEVEDLLATGLIGA